MNESLIRILLDSSIRIVPVSLAVGVLLRFCCPRFSELKHKLWSMVVFAMLLMPLLTLVVPELSVPLRIPQKEPPASSLARLSGSVMPAPLPPSSSIHERFGPGGTESPRSAPPGSVISTPSWISIAEIVYIAGAISCLFWLCMGWSGVRTIVKHSRRLVVSGHGPIYESDHVVAPVTVGLLRPKIILPSTWREWRKPERRAILAHEIEHIRRHDPLTSFLARINCSVFWFHPLAWWLDRQLAVCAEEACDNAALRSVDSPQRYAAILVGMAKAIHRSGARLSWTASGIRGTGQLAGRIDRIMTGKKFSPPSVTRTLALLLSCAAIILAVAACRGQSLPTVSEEQQALQRVQARDRERSAVNEAYRARQVRLMSSVKLAQNLGPAEAATVEAELANHPDDFDTQVALLEFYPYWAKKAGMDASAIVRGRRKHILWFIQKHPADDLASSPYLFTNTDAADPLADPEGYEQGKTAWLGQVERNRTNAAVLSNAAYFMQATDKALSERLILQAQVLQPSGPWMEKLSRLYASMILGAAAIQPQLYNSPGILILSTNTADQHGPLAEDARRKMDATTDFTLLLNTGRILVNVRNIRLDFDPVPLGVQYLQRAEAVSPSPDRTAEIRLQLSMINSSSHLARIRMLPKEGRYAAAMALSDRDRFELLWDLAVFDYGYGNSFGPNERDGALDEWYKAARYAAALASVAEKFRNDPDYGNAIFHANMMLAYVESKNGHTQETIDYVRKALKAPEADKGGDYPSLWNRVCPFLIQQGHRNEVIAFLERFAQIDPVERDSVLATVAQLRQGQTPEWWRLG